MNASFFIIHSSFRFEGATQYSTIRRALLLGMQDCATVGIKLIFDIIIIHHN